MNKDVVEFHAFPLKGVDVKLIDTNKSLEEIITMCADKNIRHPDWGMLAGKLSVVLMKQSCGASFSETTKMCSNQMNKDYVSFVSKNALVLDQMIVEERNYTFDIMAIDTLKKSYLMKRKEKGVIKQTEDPQQMYLRVATYLWLPNLNQIKQCYDSLSLKKYIHASPTLFNCGLKRPQLASCFLNHVGDSMESISKTWNDCAIISKNSGGVGLDLSSIRHSEIGETGKSRGIAPLIKVFERIFYYIDQSGKRKGSCAIYLSDWHIDFMNFVEMKKKTGDENLRAKDLFYAAWVSDLFMNRVQNNEMWSFFCPNKAKGLTEVWGLEFEKLYKKYENNKLYEKQLPARVVMYEIIKAQVETGVPYILYKDSINRKSMQSNIGIIRSSNLCAEIVLHTSLDEIASCNLSSVCINKFVDLKTNGNVPVYNFEALGESIYEMVLNMNQVIDRNYYPKEIPQIKFANLKNRPIGIGVQGFADTLALMDLCWGDKESLELNRQIFETIYYYAVKSSMEICKRNQQKFDEEYTLEMELLDETINNTKSPELLKYLLTRKQELFKNGPEKAPYETFEGSPYSFGKLHPDLWHEEYLMKKSLTELGVLQEENKFTPNTRYDWEQLRRDVKKFGVRNSTLIALMPTASSAHINQNNECIEPFNSMMFTRTILSGQFTLVNKYMVKDFEKLGIWNKKMSNDIINARGSIQDIEVPDSLKDYPLKIARFNYLKKKYKTTYEIPQKTILDMSIARSPYVCQTTSQNCHMSTPTVQKVYNNHMYGWKNGLKTGIYYLRSDPPSKAINVSTESEGCVSCSS